MDKTYEQVAFGYNDYDQDRRDEERHMIADIEHEYRIHGMDGEDY